VKCEIHIYAHYFVIRHPDEDIVPVILGVASDYTKFGMQYDPKTRKKRWVPEKTFAIYCEANDEFRFHMGQWRHFEEHFRKGALKEHR
jgi:hypothetical protein